MSEREYRAYEAENARLRELLREALEGWRNNLEAVLAEHTHRPESTVGCPTKSAVEQQYARIAEIETELEER